MIKIIFTILIFVVSTTFAATEAFTFSDLVERTLRTNSNVKQYEEKVLSKEYDQKSTLGGYAPQVSLQGSYNRINEPLSFNLDPIRDALISLEARDQVQFSSAQSQMNGGSAISPTSQLYQSSYNTYKAQLDQNVPHFIDTLKDQRYPSASLTVVQPLFTGMRLTAASRIAKADQNAAEYELRKIKNELTKETIINCINFILVNEIIDIRKDVLKGMEQHQQKAQILSEQGMIARYNLLRAKVAVAEAQRNLIDEQNRFELVSLSLKRNCSIADSVDIAINNKINYVHVNDSVDYFWKLAQKEQPIFCMIKQNKIMAQQKVLAMKGALYPQVSAFGKYELFPDYLSAMEPQWVIGVQANLTLFSGGKNVANIQSAVHLTKEVDQIEASAKRDISLLVDKNFRDMRSAESRYERLDADLELATENLHQCQSRFENGYGTSLEVIDAELVLERNRVDRLIALSDYYKSLTELYSAAGNASKAITFIIGENK